MRGSPPGLSSEVVVDAGQPTVRRDGRGGTGPLLRRILLLSGIWWMLVGGDGTGWLFGLFAVPGAAVASLLLGPGTALRLHPWPVLRFLGSFLAQSLVSGIDVARRAFHPRLPLAPAFVDYPLRVRDESARALLAATVTMLPGTIAAEIRTDRLIIHAIDAGRPVVHGVRRMEALVGALFGAELPPDASGSAGGTGSGPSEKRSDPQGTSP